MAAAAAPAHHLNPPVPMLRIHGGEHIRLRCNRVIGTGQPRPSARPGIAAARCATAPRSETISDKFARLTPISPGDHRRRDTRRGTTDPYSPPTARGRAAHTSQGPACAAGNRDDANISRSANPFPQFGREAGFGEREPLMSACVTDKQNYDTGTSPGATAVNIGAGQRDLTRPG
jgi:hypothetical protein